MTPIPILAKPFPRKSILIQSLTSRFDLVKMLGPSLAMCNFCLASMRDSLVHVFDMDMVQV